MNRFDDILTEIGSYYQSKLRQHGPTPNGVDWNSIESQRLRFTQLLRVVSSKQEEQPGRSFSIFDYGCGYGALLDSLIDSDFQVDYVGYDIATDMVAKARELHTVLPPRLTARFVSDPYALPRCDYAVASGVFNVKLHHDASGWQEYVLSTIDDFATLGKRGFAFNMLTCYSDRERMRDDLFYGDPAFFFDHCKRRYSRNVALLHDYELYEFTIIVRR